MQAPARLQPLIAEGLIDTVVRQGMLKDARMEEAVRLQRVG